MSGEEGEGEDEGEEDQKGEEKKITLPVEKGTQRERSRQQQIGKKKKERKKTQVSIFIHTQKPKCHLKTAIFHFCRAALLS